MEKFASIEKFVIQALHFHELFQAIEKKGYKVVGPTVRDGAIVYDMLSSVADLPGGWTDEQEAGAYRLRKRADNAFFGYAVGPHSWKKFLHLPVRKIWEARREGVGTSPQGGRSVRRSVWRPGTGASPQGGFQTAPEQKEIPRLAFMGVRSCELHAIFVQDKVFAEGNYVDPSYAKRRNNIFVVAVNCGKAGGTCFCVSMKTGPKAASGYDLAMTEVLEESSHYFVVETGTEAGRGVLNEVEHREAGEEEKALAEKIVERTSGQMGRTLDTSEIKELLYRNYEHPRWNNVANRCLICANCTMVCPTCFCTTIEDSTDLKGENALRLQKWDSCFTMDFSYIHGGSIRSTSVSRYRQWMTHKLAYWIDQFGTSGCVGCGRCITWCPAGIDITKEVQAIRESEKLPVTSAKEKKNGDS